MKSATTPALVLWKRSKRTLFVLAVLISLSACCHRVRADAVQPISLAHVAPTGSPEMDMLGLVNAYREPAGLRPVTLNPSLERGCREHVEYLVMNGLSGHRQDPSLPGATPAGAACGIASDLSYGEPDLQAAVHTWMGTLYHRAPILAPTLREVGVGYARDDTRTDRRTLTVALMFVGGRSSGTRWPVPFPVDGQTDVPLRFNPTGETPNPIPKSVTDPGYPITIQFPPGERLSRVRATLVDEDGQALPFLLSSPEAPARPEVRQDGLVALIARQPLRQGTSYAVSVTADWKGKTQTWSWQFSTLHIPIIEVADLETISTSKHERIALRGTIREVRRTTSTSSYVEVHLQGTESVPALVAHLPVHRFLKAVGRPVTFRGDGSGTGFRVREVEGARVELETTLKDVSVASSGALLLQVPATQKGNGFRFLLAQ